MINKLLAGSACLALPMSAYANSTSESGHAFFSLPAYLCIAIFVLAYLFVTLEEKIHLRKSKPVLLSAGLIWILIALYFPEGANGLSAEEAIKHNFIEYSELFFFLLVATAIPPF